MTSSIDIQNYAERNTSSKMPIEAKFVEAFVSSVLNSTDVKSVFLKLSQMMQNGETFSLLKSYYKDCAELLDEPYRSIIAYSMIRKDDILFWLISNLIFTGWYSRGLGADFTEVTFSNTDEFDENDNLISYTDVGAYTDMSVLMISYSFFAVYTQDENNFGYQTASEITEAYAKCKKLLTIVKPARIYSYIFLTPLVYLGRENGQLKTICVDTTQTLITPFENQEIIDEIANMSESEFSQIYNQVLADGTDITNKVEHIKTADSAEINIVIKSKNNGGNYFGEIIITSTNESVTLPPIVCTVDKSQIIAQDMTDTYFALVKLKFI